jgi:outer membrane protein assembly factor BamB
VGNARTAVAKALTAAVGIATLITGCTPAPSRPVAPASGSAASAGSASGAPSGDPDRQGPAPLWSRKVATGEHWVGAFDNVVVLTDKGSIFGVERSSGKQLWQHTQRSGLHVADNLIVLTQSAGPVEVINPATGAMVWRTDVPDKNIQVYQRAIYTDDCGGRADAGPGACRITAYDVRDGRVRWTAPAAVDGVGWHRIGPHRPVAPDSGPYLVAGVGASGKRYGAIDEKTGQALPGRSPGGGWTIFAIGTLLVTTDHDPPAGDQRCTVSMTAIDARTGAAAWSGAVFSGRKNDHSCAKSLAGRNVEDIIGAGSRIAAVAETGLPQVFDLATGRPVWVSQTAGVPLDADGASLLVRRHADTGELALLDFATGKVRWSAPDPGLAGSSASWRTAVTSGLVVVSCGYGKGQACVLVYDAVSGKQLGRFPGWLAGAGADWVAISHSDRESFSIDSLNLDFVTFDR